MTTFLDGPAKGQRLKLQRAAKFMRVTQGANGKFDALDQLEDSPRPDEKIFVYIIVAAPSHIHLHGKGCSGFYPIAEYKFVPQQPDDATMRQQSTWHDWCVEADKIY